MLQLPHKTARFPSEAADLGPSSLTCRNSESWWCAMLERWLGLRSAFFSSLLWHLSCCRFTEVQRKYGFCEAVLVCALGAVAGALGVFGGSSMPCRRQQALSKHF